LKRTSKVMVAMPMGKSLGIWCALESSHPANKSLLRFVYQHLSEPNRAWLLGVYLVAPDPYFPCME